MLARNINKAKGGGIRAVSAEFKGHLDNCGLNYVLLFSKRILHIEPYIFMLILEELS